MGLKIVIIIIVMDNILREESRFKSLFAYTKKEGWINLYKDGDKVAIGTIYPFKSEKDAKKASNDEGYDGYVATCKLTWEE